MSALSDILSLKRHHIEWGILTFLGVIAPGFLIVFHFRPALVEKYDVLKLCLLSAGLTLPLVAANFLLAGFCAPPRKIKATESDADVLLTLALFGSILMLHGALLSAYIWHLAFRQMLTVLAIMTGPFLLLVRFHYSDLGKKEANKAPEPTPTSVTPPANERKTK